MIRNTTTGFYSRLVSNKMGNALKITFEDVTAKLFFPFNSRYRKFMSLPKSNIFNPDLPELIWRKFCQMYNLEQKVKIHLQKQIYNTANLYLTDKFLPNWQKWKSKFKFQMANVQFTKRNLVITQNITIYWKVAWIWNRMLLSAELARAAKLYWHLHFGC